MAYNDQISRSEASALIPEEVTNQILQDLPKASAVMALGTRLPNMSRGQTRMPILKSLPTAFFRNPTDTGLAQTTEQTWENKYIDAEELVVLVPIPRNVLEDSDYDIWGEVRPRAVEAIGAKFDAAVFLGTDAPASWPTNIKSAANTASHQKSQATFTDLYDALLSENGICDLVEKDGYMVSGHYAVPGMKAKFRGVRDANGQPIFSQNPQQKQSYLLDGVDTFFAENGAVTSSDLLTISGDFRQLMYAIRRDIEYRLLTEGVITDNAGAVVYNLPQQGMVALMVTLRLGWQVPNPPNRVNTNASTRYPFAVLTA